MKNLEEKQCPEIGKCNKLLKAVNLGKMSKEEMENYQRDICYKKSEDCYLD